MDAVAQNCNETDRVGPLLLDWSCLGRLVRQHAMSLVEMHFASMVDAADLGLSSGRNGIPYSVEDQFVASDRVARPEVES